MTATVSPPAGFDVAADVTTLYRDGITALRGAFSREWAEAMRQDMMSAFWEAIQRPGGAIARGRHKTQKRSFHMTYWATVLLNCATLALLVSSLGIHAVQSFVGLG